MGACNVSCPLLVLDCVQHQIRREKALEIVLRTVTSVALGVQKADHMGRGRGRGSLVIRLSSPPPPFLRREPGNEARGGEGGVAYSKNPIWCQSPSCIKS